VFRSSQPRGFAPSANGPDPTTHERLEAYRGVRKIFYLLDSLSVGGTETQAVELACRLSVRGHRITLGCLRAHGPLLEKLNGFDVKVREFHPQGGIDSFGGIYQLLRLSAYLRRERFDVVHTHDLWSNLLGIPAAWLARVPARVSSRRDLSHFDWYQSSRRKWVRTIQNLSHLVLTNASAIRDSLIAEEGFNPTKVRVIHNGIDIQRFGRQGADRKQLFPDESGGKLVVLVGNMHSDVKGHDCLIESARFVVQEFPAARFVLPGDGERRPGFERQAAKLGLEHNFLFLGQRGDIPEILACCDIAVLPSKAEGLSNAILEYMAAGLPTIASRVGGSPELIRDGETGLLVPPCDPHALAEALLRLLRNPGVAYRLAKKGHEFVSQNFSFERLVEEVEDLYSELLHRGHQS
jgi:glycosyltransferase involved in cell wall biosynthesis